MSVVYLDRARRPGHGDDRYAEDYAASGRRIAAHYGDPAHSVRAEDRDMLAEFAADMLAKNERLNRHNRELLAEVRRLEREVRRFRVLTGDVPPPKRVRSNAWTVEEDALLREYAHLGPKRLAAEIIPNRTVRAIEQRIGAHGLARSKVKWSAAEEELIRAHHREGAQVLAALLPGRLPRSITVRARQLGCPVPRTRHSGAAT